MMRQPQGVCNGQSASGVRLSELRGQPAQMAGALPILRRLGLSGGTSLADCRVRTRGRAGSSERGRRHGLPAHSNRRQRVGPRPGRRPCPGHGHRGGRRAWHRQIHANAPGCGPAIPAGPGGLVCIGRGVSASGGPAGRPSGPERPQRGRAGRNHPGAGAGAYGRGRLWGGGGGLGADRAQRRDGRRGRFGEPGAPLRRRVDQSGQGQRRGPVSGGPRDQGRLPGRAQGLGAHGGHGPALRVRAFHAPAPAAGR